MHLLRAVILGLILIALAGTAHAQDCKPLDDYVSFCGDAKWTKRKSGNADVLAAYRRGPSQRLNILRDDTGRDAGITIDRLIDFQRESYALISKVPPADIPILERAPSVLGPLSGERAVYAAKVDDFEFTVAISFFVQEDWTLQVLTVDLAKGFRDEHRALHKLALDSLRIEEP